MIDVTSHGSIAILTLAHGKANVLDLELCEAIAARIDACGSAGCSAVLITGRGSIFSAGVDLVRVAAEGAPYVRRFLPALNDAFETAFAFPKPLVAAVNGHAIAGGCILACTADRRFMTQGTGRIGVPELIVGVPFPPVALEIMRDAAAPAALPSMIAQGATFAPDEAVRHGLIDEVVDGDALLNTAIASAEALASLPAAAFAITKRQLREPALARMKSGRSRFDDAVLDLWCSPITIDAIKRYIDRTLKKPGRP